MNRLGQSDPTPLGHDLDAFKRRFEAFGWRTEEIDGHDMEEIVEVLAAVGLGDQPLVILGENVERRGHLVHPGQRRLAWQAVVERGSRPRHCRTATEREIRHRASDCRARSPCPRRRTKRPRSYPPINYKLGDMVATREAFGTALARIGEVDPRVVALDGDTKNSTYSEKFFKKFPDRFTECFIAEQNMVGVATGFARPRQSAVRLHLRDVLHARF